MKAFKEGTALLVTSQVTQRSGLRKTLLDLGLENQNIEIAGDFEQAKLRLLKTPVNILVTDDEVGNNHKGMEMLMLAGAAAVAEKAYDKLAWPSTSPEDQIIDLKMRNIIYPKNKVIVDCFKLLGLKVVDPDLYRITISCLKHIGKDPGEIIQQAKRAYPSMAFE